MIPATIGEVERLDEAVDELVPPGALLEVLGEGFEWAEGPVWVESERCLLFSDIPANRIVRWSSREGCSTWLEPSGYTGATPRGGEKGSNALSLDSAGRLVLCQHGDRRVARLDTSLERPRPRFETLADRFDGRRLNSPNDLVYSRRGDLYFTDPPYGLERGAEDGERELEFCGLFRLTGSGRLDLLTDELSRPNGVALTPDESTLLVSNSDPARALWMAYPLRQDGLTGRGASLL